MNRASLNFLATIILAVVLSLFLPWWSVMIAAFISSILFDLKSFNVFLIPFLAIFLFWAVYAFYLSNGNDFILAKKIATLLSLSGNQYLLILITGVIGGVAAGIAAILGKQCNSLLKNKES